MGEQNQLEVLGVFRTEGFEDLYKLVDFLNRTLKDRGLVFGLARGEHSGEYVLTVYRA
ncbi:MAG: YpmA family protein [Alicyclobacillaceae bacterium]|nr:YpmA family protein [Alicyclobacillaceae bacterium]